MALGKLISLAFSPTLDTNRLQAYSSFRSACISPWPIKGCLTWTRHLTFRQLMPLGMNPTMLSLTEISLKLSSCNLDSFGPIKFLLQEKTWSSNNLGLHLWIKSLMRVNCLIHIIIEKKTNRKLCNVTKWSKDGLEPCLCASEVPQDTTDQLYESRYGESHWYGLLACHLP